MLVWNQGVYFDNVKNSKRTIGEKDLSDFQGNCILLLNKYKKSGQIKAAKKIMPTARKRL